MELLRVIDPAYRAAAVAVALSAALHGSVVVGIRVPAEEEASLDVPAYTARLQPATVAETPPAVVVPPPKPRPRRARPVLLPHEVMGFLPDPPEAELPPLAALEPFPMEPAPDRPPPEVVALAQPSVPGWQPALPVFEIDALPEEVTIAYSLTSAFADGEAEYAWKREGDRYLISGRIQATGFFTVFLEGRIEQEATGHVTPEGLRPARFSERRPNAAAEGLAFDWDAGTVEFQRGEERRTGPLTDTTVDWLSMIFQLAHLPPKGDSMDLRVFTQRRLYQYRLQVLGVEELELPLGKVNALHLRHVGEKADEAVDVWLGAEHYFLPVKLRYPILKNRLVVEQTATAVRTP